MLDKTGTELLREYLKAEKEVREHCDNLQQAQNMLRQLADTSKESQQ